LVAADAYYQQQTNLAAATIAEGTAESASISGNARSDDEMKAV